MYAGQILAMTNYSSKVNKPNTIKNHTKNNYLGLHAQGDYCDLPQQILEHTSSSNVKFYTRIQKPQTNRQCRDTRNHFLTTNICKNTQQQIHTKLLKIYLQKNCSYMHCEN